MSVEKMKSEIIQPETKEIVQPQKMGLLVMPDQTSSVFFPWFSSTSTKYLFLTLKDPDKVLWV